MALVTSPQTIPDLNYEYHTITIDSSVVKIVLILLLVTFNNPLKMWFRPDFLVRIFIQRYATEHCYISINELTPSLTDSASNVLTGQGHLEHVRSSFASLVTAMPLTGLITY